MEESIATDTAGLPRNGQSRSDLLSSNTTLFWRVFIPVFGTVFVAGLALAFWLSSEEDLYLPYPVWVVRLAMMLVLIGWLLLIRRTLWRLKRVEADDSTLFVTNYWVTARYLWEDVARLEEKSRLGRRIINIHLKGAGRFGSKISFLPGSRYRAWLEEHGKIDLLFSN